MMRWPAAFLICLMGSLSACSINSMMDMGDTPRAEKAAKREAEVAALVKKLHEAPHWGPGLTIVGFGSYFGQFAEENRVQAAWDLGHDLKAYSAIPDLAQALKDPNPRVRCDAAASLWAMADHAQSVQTELREALNDSYSRVRLNAARALWTMGVATTDLFPVLIDISAGPDLADAVNAADLEITIGKAPKDVIPVLLRGMADPEVAETVISNVVARDRDIAYVPVFLAGANSANYEVRYSSINNLAAVTYASREVSAVIRSATSDPVGSVRQVAVESLVDVRGTVEGSADGTAGETMALLVKLLSDRDPGIRRSAVVTLSWTRTGDPAIIAALAKHLKDSDYNVREVAATAMGKMKISTPEVIAALVVCLKDPDRYTVTQAAAEALGKIGKPANAAAPALRSIYQEIRKTARSKGENPDSDFATKIYRALVDMGEPPPEDRPQWP